MHSEREVHGSHPNEVTTDRAPAYPRVLDELLPGTCHTVEQYATDEIVNPVESIMDGSKPDCGRCVA